MANQLQQMIHRLSTDGNFRQRFLEDPRGALSPFELSEEEQNILFDMRAFLTQSRPADGPNGPWDWQFSSSDVHASDGPNGPWDWQFSSLDVHASDGPNGPWDWQFSAPETKAQTS